MNPCNNCGSTWRNSDERERLAARTFRIENSRIMAESIRFASIMARENGKVSA